MRSPSRWSRCSRRWCRTWPRNCGRSSARSGRVDGGTITYVEFPTADPALLVDDTVEVPIQINGKVRSKIEVAADASKDDIEAAALADPKVVQALDGGSPKKVIVVPGRMVNVVV